VEAEWADLERSRKNLEFWERLREGGPEVDAALDCWRKQSPPQNATKRE
jgi:hypothetical protein